MPSKLLPEEIPDCGMQARVVGQSAVKPAAAGVANVVKAEFAGVVKST
jgi:hypothetical protein